MEATVQIIPSTSLLREVEARSGQPIIRCYQCKKCSGGCPMAFVMDILPSQVIRYVQLGLRDKLLRSNSIWVCSCCKTCRSRCPNGIDVSMVIDALKGIARESGTTLSEPKINAFHQAFLNSVAKNGRVHELGMIGAYKVKTGTYFQDFSLGIKMFRRGKLKFFSEKIKGRRGVARIFQLAKERRS